MEQLIGWDKQLSVFINSFHSPSLDGAMLMMTKTSFWAPLYFVILYFIYKKQEAYFWHWVIGVAVAVAVADQITSAVFKPLFERLRPSHDPSLEGIIHLAKTNAGELYRGGLYGFASSHAANSFAAAMFVFLLFKRNFYSALVFIWAAFLSYTRIYLGVHFAGDILAGSIVGLITGYAGYRLSLFLISKTARK